MALMTRGSKSNCRERGIKCSSSACGGEGGEGRGWGGAGLVVRGRARLRKGGGAPARAHLVKKNVLAVSAERGKVLQHAIGTDAVLQAQLLPELHADWWRQAKKENKK